MQSPTRSRSFDRRHELLYGLGITVLFALLATTLWQSRVWAAESGVALPPLDMPASSSTATGLQTAVLAGGCFWGLEAVYQHLDGVTDVVSGYSGGKKSTADYRTTSTGRTGHAESVKITFDPQKVSYAQLLQVYFSVAHNPTQLNRQGPDTGPQYRSNVFYANDSQKAQAQAYIDQLNASGVFAKPMVTRVDPLTAFYPAEAYHQNFAYRHPNHGYIVVNDLPKVENLQRLFPDMYRDTPVIVAAQ